MASPQLSVGCHGSRINTSTIAHYTQYFLPPEYPVGLQSNAHLHAEVVRLHPEEDFRRSRCRVPTWRARIQDIFSSIDSHLDDLDVLERNGRGTQIPIVHEMGHYLGLHHVAGEGDESAAYGEGYQGGDIMGSGVRLESWHAFPWKKRLKMHIGHTTGVMQWNVTTVRPAPRPAPLQQRQREPMLPGGMPGPDAGV
ncbi:MAG: hypothetical protein V3W04_00795 [Gammaproteobacteria bacterium]